MERSEIDQLLESRLSRIEEMDTQYNLYLKRQKKINYFLATFLIISIAGHLVQNFAHF